MGAVSSAATTWCTTRVFDRARAARYAFAVPVLALVLLVALISPVLVHAVEAWSSEDYLTFGFLVPPVVAVLVWLRRAELQASAVSRARHALWPVVTSLGLYLLCERVSAKSPAAVAAGLLGWSVCAYLWGWKAGHVLVLPAVLLTYSLALQQTLLAPIAFALQGVTAVGAAWTSQVLGLPIVLDGLVLRGPDYAFIVAEECSGMNSLLALFGLGLTWIALVRGGGGARIGVLASVLPLVVLANIARVVLVLLVADALGQDAATGFFHEFSSLVLFGGALAGMLVVSRALQCRAYIAQ